jgi:hypothetical protein
MAIAGFKAKEFSTARELALFVTTNDDVETIFATTFNTASGKYSVFFADLATVANAYLRSLSEVASPSTSTAVTQKMAGTNKGTESVAADASQDPGVKRPSSTQTETASASALFDRSDP